MLRAVLAAVALLTLAHCDSPKTPPKSAADRLARAETAVEECTKRQGIECRLELDELAAARRP